MRHANHYRMKICPLDCFTNCFFNLLYYSSRIWVNFNASSNCCCCFVWRSVWTHSSIFVAFFTCFSSNTSTHYLSCVFSLFSIAVLVSKAAIFSFIKRHSWVSKAFYFSFYFLIFVKSSTILYKFSKSSSYFLYLGIRDSSSREVCSDFFNAISIYSRVNWLWFYFISLSYSKFLNLYSNLSY